MKTTLVVIFNHAYPANIPKLRAIYEERFEDIVFLIPAVTMSDPAVLTVYRGAYNFHGHVADSLAFLKARESDLYMFVQDDLLLNRSLTPESFYQAFGMAEHDGFIPEPESFSAPGREAWPWNDRVLTRLNETDLLYGGGFEDAWRHLPPLEEARARFHRLGFDSLDSPKRPRRHGGLKTWMKTRIDGSPVGLPAELPYPLAVAFSDMFALRGDALATVGRYLGVFAAMDLFVEVSIPTAMILGCANLATLAGSSWKVLVDWTSREILAREGPTRLSDYYDRFDEQTLYLHPVKLSRVHV